MTTAALKARVAELETVAAGQRKALKATLMELSAWSDALSKRLRRDALAAAGTSPLKKVKTEVKQEEEKLEEDVPGPVLAAPVEMKEEKEEEVVARGAAAAEAEAPVVRRPGPRAQVPSMDDPSKCPPNFGLDGERAMPCRWGVKAAKRQSLVAVSHSKTCSRGRFFNYKAYGEHEAKVRAAVAEWEAAQA